MAVASYAGLSDIGRRRISNEDRWFADPREGLYLVADGIGGLAAGDLASQVVAEVLPRMLREKLVGARGADPETAALVVAALAELSEQLRHESEAALGVKGAGSTVVLALVRRLQALIAHLGDSRAYLLHAGRLEQLTTDHTLAQLLAARGELPDDEAAARTARGQLTRFVGMAAKALPQVRTVALSPGDRLLLCSDGLSGLLSTDEILAVLNAHPLPEEACRHLVGAANAAGGNDNITAVVVQIGDETAGSNTG